MTQPAETQDPTPNCTWCGKPLHRADMLPFSVCMQWHPMCWREHWKAEMAEEDKLDMEQRR